MSPLGAAVLGGLLGLLIGFVVSALLHGPSRPPNKGGGGSGWNGHPVPPVPAEALLHWFATRPNRGDSRS